MMSEEGDNHDPNDDVEIHLTIGEAAIRKWANVKRISRPSVEHLIDLGFNSMEALALLTESDPTESEIPLGQRKLIVYSVKQTFP
jgi:predicted XRE-type DNA-binding protein